ncbi:hypothetical protein ACTHAL_000786 [Priestia flexa]|uniref:hypothetical protein n=1 Tax=Bacillaceae TaxID=186817 RepID=UPI00047314D3|nr:MULTISPECIES: hypothetical protein [Bacillaceae]MCA1201953.1 hypothetical protein [Priestia flexa]UYZ22409.1 hypothetical protein FOF60_02120 [Mesobacillus jeotgali]
MKLPNGVTGFYDSKVNKPPQVDGKQFKQLCFDFASRNSGKVIDFITPQYPSNFYYAHVEIVGNQFYILLNEHYPYLAFASIVEFGNIKFINRPVPYEKFSSFYRVIGTGELNVPLNQKLLKQTELNSAELEQIAYWKPETVGQIIFNYWD